MKLGYNKFLKEIDIIQTNLSYCIEGTLDGNLFDNYLAWGAISDSSSEGVLLRTILEVMPLVSNVRPLS